MRQLTFRQVIIAFLMLLILSLLQYAIGIDGLISFLIGVLAAAIAAFFGIKVNDIKKEGS